MKKQWKGEISRNIYLSISSSFPPVVMWPEIGKKRDLSCRGTWRRENRKGASRSSFVKVGEFIKFSFIKFSFMKVLVAEHLLRAQASV